MLGRARIRRVWNRVVPWIPLPLRVSPGFWWIARNDALSDSLFEGTFERAERALICAMLRPGMTVVDVGANAGVYTMTAARLVGPSGRVIAFEPSERERVRLQAHLRLNGLSNVTVEPTGLGSVDEEADLYVVEGRETGFNSLRDQRAGLVRPTKVRIVRLDDYVERERLSHIDFVKLDVEGGELDVLRGAEQVFRHMRPSLLCEIEEARIEPWGYQPRDIVNLVAGWGYQWFAIREEGRLTPLPPGATRFSGNLLARPT